MRILIVSKFFYPRGGACVVAMGTRQVLMDAGHTVRVFAMEYPLNIKLPESESFASNVDFSSGLTGKIKAFKRILGMGDVVDSFKKVLDEFKPDVVHLHNIHSYLSPVVGELAHKTGARVVWTLHDLKLICPAYTLRKGNGELCSDFEHCSVIKDRCLKNSRIHSTMAYLEAKQWHRSRLDAMTDIFIAPSEFMGKIMTSAGFPASKIKVLNNFIDPPKLESLTRQATGGKRSRDFAYIGRLSHEKGVATLIKAAIKAGVSLKLAGDGPEREKLEKLAQGCKNIAFLGKLNAGEIVQLLSSVQASVISSEWYENNPLSVIESLCAGTPVIGADIGGIPELIELGVSGRHYPSGDVDALAAVLSDFRAEDYDNNKIAEKAINRFSIQNHLKQLLEIYQVK